MSGELTKDWVESNHKSLTLWFQTGPFVDDTNQDQTAQNVQSDLGLCRPFVTLFL